MDCTVQENEVGNRKRKIPLKDVREGMVFSLHGFRGRFSENMRLLALSNPYRPTELPKLLNCRDGRVSVLHVLWLSGMEERSSHMKFDVIVFPYDNDDAFKVLNISKDVELLGSSEGLTISLDTER